MQAAIPLRSKPESKASVAKGRIQLEFVTISNPSDSKSQRNRQKVRRHAAQISVQPKVPETRKTVRTSKSDSPTAEAALLAHSGDILRETGKLPSASDAESQNMSLSLRRPENPHPKPSRQLGVGPGFGFNPFVSFPVNLTARETILISHRRSYPATDCSLLMFPSPRGCPWKCSAYGPALDHDWS
jgi:hypothetical protein